MSKTADTAIKLMTDMVPASVAKARNEADEMQKLIGTQFNLQPWNCQFYAEQVRKAKYEIDQQQVKISGT